MTVTPELEAMARAFTLARDKRLFGGLSEAAYAEHVEREWRWHVDDLRAALLAIREPEGALLRQIQRIRFAMRVGKITGLDAEGPAFTAIIDYLLGESQP